MVSVDPCGMTNVVVSGLEDVIADARGSKKFSP
jgi:hypothetical protein